jgi:hypothetical protein
MLASKCVALNSCVRVSKREVSHFERTINLTLTPYNKLQRLDKMAPVQLERCQAKSLLYVNDVLTRCKLNRRISVASKCVDDCILSWCLHTFTSAQCKRSCCLDKRAEKSLYKDNVETIKFADFLLSSWCRRKRIQFTSENSTLRWVRR